MKTTLKILLFLSIATTSLAKANNMIYIKITKSSKGRFGLGKAKVINCKTLKTIGKARILLVRIKGGSPYKIPVSENEKKPVFTIISKKNEEYYCVALPYRVICISKSEYGVSNTNEIKVFKKLSKLKNEKPITKDIVNMALSQKFKNCVKDAKIHPILKETDYYKILDVSRNAPKREIKKAWMNLVKKYHPDRSKHPQATEITEKLNAAYEALK